MTRWGCFGGLHKTRWKLSQPDGKFHLSDRPNFSASRTHRSGLGAPHAALKVVCLNFGSHHCSRKPHRGGALSRAIIVGTGRKVFTTFCRSFQNYVSCCACPAAEKRSVSPRHSSREGAHVASTALEAREIVTFFRLFGSIRWMLVAMRAYGIPRTLVPISSLDSKNLKTAQRADLIWRKSLHDTFSRKYVGLCALFTVEETGLEPTTILVSPCCVRLQIHGPLAPTTFAQSPFDRPACASATATATATSSHTKSSKPLSCGLNKDAVLSGDKLKDGFHCCALFDQHLVFLLRTA